MLVLCLAYAGFQLVLSPVAKSQVLIPILGQTPLQSVLAVQYQAVSLKKKKPWIPQFQQFQLILVFSACSLSHTCPWSQDRHPKGLNLSYSFNPSD